MHNLVIVLLILLNTSYLSPQFKKCCDTNSYLKNNSAYICCEDENKNQIFENETIILKNLTENNYTVGTERHANQTFIQGTQFFVNYYPKCCPLNYSYHSVAHSCIPKKNSDENFITMEYVKVGLFECKVIVDYKLIFQKYEIEFGNLYIDKVGVFEEGKFCVDRDESDFLIARGCYDDLSVCHDGIKCIHKCCPDGQSFVNEQCEDTFRHGLNLSFTDRINNSEDDFAIIHRYDCRIYILPDTTQGYIDNDGTFFAFSNKTNSFLRFEVEDKSYCIEHINWGNTSDFEFLICFPDIPIPWKFVITRWTKIISCIFIVLTIFIYFIIPEMLNLFGKILVSYCIAMLIFFIVLTYGQFEIEFSDSACVSVGFLSSYFSIASFSWLNVMCFYIWSTFRTPKSFVMSAKQRKNELKRYIFSSLYGWGLPAVLTLLALLAYGVFNTPYAIRPILGTYKCYWERRVGNYGMFLYYITPIILMEFINFILFLRTIIYCLDVKGELNRLNDSKIMETTTCYNIDKEQLILILKLSVTMGFSSTFDLIEVVLPLFNSSFSESLAIEYMETIWDTINCLQGLYIFLIFICKRKVFRLFRKKIFSTKSSSAMPTGTTQVSNRSSSKFKF